MRIDPNEYNLDGIKRGLLPDATFDQNVSSGNYLEGFDFLVVINTNMICINIWRNGRVGSSVSTPTDLLEHDNLRFVVRVRNSIATSAADVAIEYVRSLIHSN